MKNMGMERQLRCAQCGATRARNGNEFTKQTLRVHTGRMHGPKKAKSGEALYRLTAKEQEVVLLLAVGKTRQEIAGQLNLTKPSLRTYVWRIGRKLAAKRQVEAALNWFKANLTPRKDFRDGKRLLSAKTG